MSRPRVLPFARQVGDRGYNVARTLPNVDLSTLFPTPRALGAQCLILGLVAGLVLAGCRTERPNRGLREAEVNPVAALTPAPVPEPTYTPPTVAKTTPSVTEPALTPTATTTVGLETYIASTIQTSSDFVPWVPSVWKAAGTYPPGAVHEGIRYQLHASGPTVILHLTAVQAPVHHQARQQPTVLWQVPEELRPATPVTWEVEGWPVLADGAPDPDWPGPHRFTLQVDPDGAVHYVNNAQVDLEGYLRFAATLVWPPAGAAPGVCRRSDEVRAAIQAALSETDGSRPSCERVTWAQLATIRILRQADEDPVRVGHAHDLAGLTGLEEAALQFSGTRWRPYLLLQAPRLQRLWLDTPHLEQMAMGLAGTMTLPALTHLTWQAHLLQELLPGRLPLLPNLTHLTLQAPELRDLPPGWLAALPTLTHLDVYGDLRDLQTGWLSRLPNLTHLTLKIDGGWTHTIDRGWIREGIDLPPYWLPALPNLTHMELDAQYLQHLRPDWLPPLPTLTHLKLESHRLETLPALGSRTLPALTHLELVGSTLDDLPADWLRSVPTLTSLRLNAPLSHLSPHWLPPLPNLTHLTLDRAGTLPRDWAQRLPNLIYLDVPYLPQQTIPPLPNLAHLTLDHVWDITGEWARHVPNLTHLTLTLSGDPPRHWAQSLLAGWLPPLPALTHLELDVNQLQNLSSGWLPPLPTLTHLALHGDQLQRLQAGWLPLLPALTHLELEVAQLQSLSSGWMPLLPALTHLELDGGQLQRLPEEWLPPLPALTHLTLHGDQIQYMLAGWLPPLPVLTHLELDVSRLQSLSSGWLPSLPALTHLELDASGSLSRLVRPVGGGGWHDNELVEPIKFGPLSTLPAGLLTPVPALTHLTLFADGLTALPADLLAPVPTLAHLALELGGLTALPTDLLVAVPALTHLTLHADRLVTWPTALLDPVPLLTHLFLDVDGLTALPPNWLSSLPQLTTLYLYADRLTALPPDFLTTAPHLRKLNLYADRLTALSPDFLTTVPQLGEVFLWGACLPGLPRHFLRTAPPHVQLFWEGATSWPLPPEHLWDHLWDLNRGDYTGPFVSVTAPAVLLRDYPSYDQGQVVGVVGHTYIDFPVIQRHTDETGQLWLQLWKPITSLQPPRGYLNWLPPYHHLFQTIDEIWIAADSVELVEVSREGVGCRPEEGG